MIFPISKCPLFAHHLLLERFILLDITRLLSTFCILLANFFVFNSHFAMQKFFSSYFDKTFSEIKKNNFYAKLATTSSRPKNQYYEENDCAKAEERSALNETIELHNGARVSKKLYEPFIGQLLLMLTNKEDPLIVIKATIMVLELSFKCHNPKHNMSEATKNEAIKLSSPPTERLALCL